MTFNKIDFDDEDELLKSITLSKTQTQTQNSQENSQNTTSTLFDDDDELLDDLINSNTTLLPIGLEIEKQVSSQNNKIITKQDIKQSIPSQPTIPQFKPIVLDVEIPSANLEKQPLIEESKESTLVNSEDTNFNTEIVQSNSVFKSFDFDDDDELLGDLINSNTTLLPIGLEIEKPSTSKTIAGITVDENPVIQYAQPVEDLFVSMTEEPIKEYEENNQTIEIEKPTEKTSQDTITLNNGQTVSDFIKSKRKRKSKKETIYVSADIDTLEEDRLKLDKPEALDKFIKAKGKPIGYEKQILKSLKLTEEELSKLVAPSSSLSDVEKAKLLSVGYFGTDNREEKGKQKKFVNTGDKDLLEFLDKVKLATTKHLSTATGRTPETINVNMGRLHRMGIVSKVQAYGTQIIWSLTQTGLSLIGSDRKPVDSKLYEPLALSERFYVNHICACIWNNKVNALGLEDFPYKGRRTDKGIVEGETFVPEADIMSSLSRKLSEVRVGFTKDRYKGESMSKLSDNWEIAWNTWEREGRNVESPELEAGNEYLYALFSPSIMTSSYILPDIVVVRERNSDGSPNSIAVEVEKMVKSVDEYIKKLTVYKEDDRVYGQVIYVTPNKKTAENIKKAAETIGFDRFDIMPMLDKNGELTTEKNGWLI